jgi:phosphoglycerol transferase MdoB-like AlkP superfamily enzyme
MTTESNTPEHDDELEANATIDGSTSEAEAKPEPIDEAETKPESEPKVGQTECEEARGEEEPEVEDFPTAEADKAGTEPESDAEPEKAEGQSPSVSGKFAGLKERFSKKKVAEAEDVPAGEDGADADKPADTRSIGERVMNFVAGGIVHVGSMFWLLPFAALCWALYTLTNNGMLICSNEQVMPLAIVIGVGLAVALFREPILGVLDALTTRGGAVSHLGGLSAEFCRSLVGLLVCTICSIIAIETPWNTSVGEIAVNFLLIDFVVIFCILVALFFLGQRTGWLVAVGVVACYALGIGQTFVIEFKGTALLPADLMALSTAAEVAGGYTYNVTAPMLAATVALTVALIFCCLMRPCTSAPKRVFFVRPLANVAIALACFFGIQSAFYNVSLQNDLGVSTDVWWPINSYTAGGFLPHFLNLFQKLQIEKPADYSEETAQADEDELASVWQASQTESRAAAEAQFSEVQPSVICVMNETFSDLSLLNGLDVGYEGPAYFNSISDALVRGSLEVSAYGGGTCNSEFEFMTSSSLAYIGSGNYPYTYYDLSQVGNLAAQFSELGYDTTAIHPNAATNWNREETYAGFGFDRFLSIADFDGATCYHSGVSDAETYQKVLDRLNSTTEPQFFLDVTMQNHSGYDQYNIPEEDQLDYTFDFDPDNTALTHELNEYLACINASDRDLEWFMNELRNLDRPVVLIFFGDHQPGMSGNVNDAINTNEDDTTHGARAYRTNYLVWTNYHVEGSGEMQWEDASTSTLAALALQYVGAPLTEFQQATLGARASMPMLNMFAYKDNEGTWHSVDDATPSERDKAAGDGDGGENKALKDATTDAARAAAEACQKLSRVQYLEFATKVI